jgi:hypothetical protein
MSVNMTTQISLGCWILGLNNVNAFTVEILDSITVDNLKRVIKDQNENTLKGVDAHELEIWKVSDPAQRARHD